MSLYEFHNTKSIVDLIILSGLVIFLYVIVIKFFRYRPWLQLISVIGIFTFTYVLISGYDETITTWWIGK